MSITISKIAYINCKRLEELKFILNESSYDFVEKVENEDSEEVWVLYSSLLVEALVKAGYLSNQEKTEMAKIDDEIGVTEILFYG